jgi:putative ABC transport system permease protein
MFLRRMFTELFAQKTRIILTILAIAWGTFSIASMLAIGEGLRLNFAQAVANAGHNLLTVDGGVTSKSYKGMAANRVIKLNQQDLAAITHSSYNIASISPEYNFTKTARHGSHENNIQIQAVNAKFNKIHEIAVKRGGRFISPLDLKQFRPVIVLGTKALESLFPSDPNPVGRYIHIANKPFLVIGVMRKKSQLIATQMPDEYLNWVPVSTYSLYYNPQTIDSISITYKDVKRLKVLEKQIRKVVALNHGADPSDEDIVDFGDLAKRQQSVNTFFFGMEIFLGIVGALTLFIAGVGIANVMFASVKRATHEIGIRMAIGARTYHILSHYILEAMMATVIGGILGLLMTLLLIKVINIIPMQGKVIDAIGRPHPVLSLSVLAVVILVLGLIGFLAGFFPALKAASIEPSEALRYE